MFFLWNSACFIFVVVLQQILKNICDHPDPLILKKVAAEGTLEGMEDMDGKLNGHYMARLKNMAVNGAGYDDDALQVGQLEVACKLSFIMSLLVNILWCMLIWVVRNVLHICLFKLNVASAWCCRKIFLKRDTMF